MVLVAIDFFGRNDVKRPQMIRIGVRKKDMNAPKMASSTLTQV